MQASRRAPPQPRWIDPFAPEHIRRLVAEFGSPLLVIDCARVRAQYRSLARALPGVDLHYALKPLPHAAVIETIVQTARPYVFTTASPPMLAETLLASLALLRGDDERRARLARHVARFRAGAASLPWRLLDSTTPIQPLVVGDNRRALGLARALEARGLFVPAIRPPTVPEGTARLRVSFSAAHDDADVDRLLHALHAIAREAP